MWRFINGNQTWWKKVLEVKYLNFTRQQFLQQEIPNRPCSKIWSSCKKSIPLLAQNISKVPKGGNTINIGMDRIMGQIPIMDSPDTQNILHYYSNMGLKFLSQFSKWDAQTQMWIGWNFPNIPPHLEDELRNLQSYIHGSAPIKKDSIDGFH